jgi:hypothetical protein
LYALANPTTLTDPSGHSADNRSLTSWLLAELNQNSTGYYARSIRRLLSSSSPQNVLRGFAVWTLLVMDEARWDFKHEIAREIGESVILQGTSEPRWYDYSVPGNIHFGYVGRAAGFSESTLHWGAGVAEILDPAHVERGEACCPQHCFDMPGPDQRCISIGCFYVNPEWVSSLFDDPTDYTTIEFGMQLYRDYPSGVTMPQFRAYVSGHGTWLSPPPEVPGSVFDQHDWEYEVGDFNGPKWGYTMLANLVIVLGDALFGH